MTYDAPILVGCLPEIGQNHHWGKCIPNKSHKHLAKTEIELPNSNFFATFRNETINSNHHLEYLLTQRKHHPLMLHCHQILPTHLILAG